MNKISFFIITILVSSINNAYALDFGSVSDTVTGLLGNISELLDVISWVAGVGFGVSAIVKYNEHRQRPQSVPIGGPVIDLILAVVLISFPFIMQVTAKTQENVKVEQLGQQLNDTYQN
jgi:hypothetical protein